MSPVPTTESMGRAGRTRTRRASRPHPLGVPTPEPWPILSQGLSPVRAKSEKRGEGEEGTVAVRGQEGRVLGITRSKEMGRLGCWPARGL